MHGCTVKHRPCLPEGEVARLEWKPPTLDGSSSFAAQQTTPVCCVNRLIGGVKSLRQCRAVSAQEELLWYNPR